MAYVATLHDTLLLYCIWKVFPANMQDSILTCWMQFGKSEKGTNIYSTNIDPADMSGVVPLIDLLGIYLSVATDYYNLQ